MREQLFVTLLGTSAFVSAIILLLKLTSGYFNKNYDVKCKYWIWLVLALRLIIPFNISYPSSIVTVNIPNTPISAFVNTNALQQNTDIIPVQTENIEQGTTNIPALLSQTNRVTPINVFMLIWVVGFVLFLIYQIIGCFIFRKRALRWSKEPKDAQIINRICEITTEMGLKKEITVFISESISSPMMTGFSKPLLFLPKECYSDTDLNFILRHELTHYKRHDIWYKLFLIIVNAVHWFNPFMYLLFREASADLELSCDDKVINGLSRGERILYSETILASIAEKKSLKTALSTYFYGGQKAMKNRFANILNANNGKKKRNGWIVLLTVILTVGILGSLIACNLDTGENKLLTNLGYTKTFLTDMLNNKTTLSDDDVKIDHIIKSLPLQSYRKYISYYLQTEPLKEINVVYEIDGSNDSYNRGGNGIDPFYEIVEENNALLLFAVINGLDKVNFLSYDDYDKQEINRTVSYTVDDLTRRFGNINPTDMDFSDLYNSLGANIQLSEFYFAHHSRIYLGVDSERVSYRNGEPNEIKEQSDGSVVWIYTEFGKIYSISPDSAEIADPGNTAMYYFDSVTAEKNDNLTGLYATRFIHGDNYGKSYYDITEILGLPSAIKNMGSGDKYIAYALAEGQQKNAYFIFHNDKVIEEGVMYGNNYAILNLEQKDD